MKYLQTYNQLLENKAEKNAMKKIEKFFKDDYVAKQAIDLNPKLAVWIVNQFKEHFIKSFDSLYARAVLNVPPGMEHMRKPKEDKPTKEDVENYFKGTLEDIKKLNGLKRLSNLFWTNFMVQSFQNINDWVKSPDITPEEKADVVKGTWQEADDKATEWHRSLKAGGPIKDEHGKVIMTFPDGYYWIDLETKSDEAEAEAMGHCGRTNKGNTLYSLRDKKKQPHVTVAIDDKEGVIYQMKGKENKKPIPKYHKYIVDLLTNDDLKTKIKGFSSEYDRDEDFRPEDLNPKMRYDLLKKRPDIEKSILSKEDIEWAFGVMLGQMEERKPFSIIELYYDVIADKHFDALKVHIYPEFSSVGIIDVLMDIHYQKVVKWCEENHLEKDEWKCAKELESSFFEERPIPGGGARRNYVKFNELFKFFYGKDKTKWFNQLKEDFADQTDVLINDIFNVWTMKQIIGRHYPSSKMLDYMDKVGFDYTQYTDDW